LKYFTKPENKAEDKLPVILNEIGNLHSLSPLLILNILSKNKNVNFKIVKDFFSKKLKED